MKHKSLRKNMVLLFAVLLVGVSACGEDTGKTPVKETGEPTNKVVTQVPEVQEAIDEGKDNEAEESAERTAIIVLSDGGISINGTGCKAEENCLKIKEAGVYEISGTLSDGSICVNAEKDSEVQLILNGVTVHNETSAALFCKKASKVTITLAKDSENILTDGAKYVFEEGEDEPDATLFSKQDLIINGEGKLTVTSAYKDAVKGKDALYILGGTVAVSGVDDGIIGKDLLYIGGGDVSVNVAADALKSTNDKEEALGSVVIEGGSVFLMAGEDGIQSEGNVSVKGGVTTISAGDDGIHAEKTIQIEGDSVLTIAKSVEGIEALEIVMDGGAVEVTATDDGINAAGGEDTGTDKQPGRGMFGEGDGELIINGGAMTVNAGGDGIDANGNITMNGGMLVVLGPTGGGNGVLDFGGSFMINGGTLLAMGGSEMAQIPADASGQYSLTVVSDSAVQAGSLVEILVGDQVVISKETPKRVNYIVASSSEMKEGATVVVKAGGDAVCEATLAEKVTVQGKLLGMGGLGFGGRGNRPQMGEQPDWKNGKVPQMPDGERMPGPDWDNGEMPAVPGDGPNA